MKTMPTTSFTFRIETELKRALEAEAKDEDRSAAYIATQAIKQFLRAKKQQQIIIEKAVAEADKGAFVSQAAVHAWMDSWDTDGELPMPEPDISVKL